MRSVLLLSSVLAAGAPLSLSPPGPDRHHWRACDSRGPHATPLRSTNSGSVAAVLGRRRIWCAPGHASAIWTNCLFPLLRDSIRASWGGGCSLECCFEAPFVGNSRAAGGRLVPDTMRRWRGLVSSLPSSVLRQFPSPVWPKCPTMVEVRTGKVALRPSIALDRALHHRPSRPRAATAPSSRY